MNRPDQRKVANLRMNSFIALILLLIEIGIGVSVNLFATLPTTDASKSVFVGFAKALMNGPAALTVHALLGIVILLASGITAVVRSFLVHRATPRVLSCIALFATLVAWLSGSNFVATQNDESSLSMAIAAVVAVSCYAAILFATPVISRYGDAIGDTDA